MKIMYMGTPAFAAKVLRILREEFGDAEITVVTKPDTPKGRAYKLTPCETKVEALSLGLRVFEPENLKEENFSDILKEASPDIIIVAAYGKILPEYVLNFAPLGAINVHGSLLPEYRGAAPVNRAIMDGKTKTGITIMYMEKGLDTGDMLSKAEVDIDDNTTATELFEKLAELGGRLAAQTVRDILEGRAVREKQDDSLATWADKITNGDQIIDWNKSPFEIVRKIHGLSNEPTALTKTPDGKILRIFRAEISNDIFDAPSGEIVVMKKKIQVAAKGGSVILKELQLEGGKRMTAADFINGRKLALGDILS